MENGAPGNPPDGNCVTKCVSWLKRCNSDQDVDALEVLGGVLQEFMDRDVDEIQSGTVAEGQSRIRRALAKNGLSYQLNGRVLRASASPSTLTLADLLRAGNYSAVEAEFNRALASVESDPATGITAASSLIESLCKCYIEDRGLALPPKQTIRELWRVVRDDLGLSPKSVTDADLRKILTGLASIVEGVGALRTHTGSAHGRAPNTPPVSSREARLGIHSAHTLAVYIMELWHGVR